MENILNIYPSTLGTIDISDNMVYIEFDKQTAFEEVISDDDGKYDVYFGHDGHRLVITKIVAHIEDIFNGNIDDIVVINAEDDDSQYTLAEIIALLSGI